MTLDGLTNLVVTRRGGQAVIIGDPRNPIGRITIVRVKGERVHLELEFPLGMPVHREEVAAKLISKAQEAAA